MPADATEFLKGIADHRAAVMPVIADAVRDFGLKILDDSGRLCPVDTGALAASGTWDGPTINGDTVTIIIGYNTNYALAVHERLVSSKGNPINHSQGQAKFLETAIVQNGPTFVPFVESRLKGANLP